MGWTAGERRTSRFAMSQERKKTDAAGWHRLVDSGRKPTRCDRLQHPCESRPSEREPCAQRIGNACGDDKFADAGYVPVERAQETRRATFGPRLIAVVHPHSYWTLR